MFVAHLITHAHFHKEDDQRQPGDCSGDQRQYSFTTAWDAIQVTNFMQKRFALQQDGVYAIPHSGSKHFWMGEKLAKHLTKCTQQRFALQQDGVHAVPHCCDKECELSSAGKSVAKHLVESTQGLLNLRHRRIHVMSKMTYAWNY
jgi:hypothetical protein